ncbi:hypothetical protein TeGR_g2361, partial [Tetraparma gracilis]
EMFFEARGGGDEFMAVKPFLGAIKAPKGGGPTPNPLKPKVNVEIGWVWGYNGLEARYGADGGVCYSAAALALSLKQGEGEGAATEQKICQGHDDDVQAFCMSNDRALMATGQMGKAPNVKIWDSESCLLLATLTSKELRRGVAALAFNEEGDKLVAVGQDDDHMLVVFEDTGGRWSTVEEKASGKGDKAKVLFASWDGEGVVAGGLKFMKFFSIDGKNIKSKKGVFGKDGKIQALPCCCVYKKGGGEGANAVVTGTADGNLYVWEDRNCARVVPLEGGGAVFACKYVKYENAAPGEEETGGRVVVGDKSGNVFVLDEDLAVLKKFKVDGQVKSVDMISGKILCGLKSSELVEISASEGTPLGADNGVITQGHSDGELWGLAPNEWNTDLVATMGDDKMLKVWSIEKKKVLCSLDVGDGGRAVDWRSATEIGVGLGMEGGAKKGKGKGKKGGKGGGKEKFSVALFRMEGGELKKVGGIEDLCKGWISDLKFSAKGDCMAVGSHDNKIYVYGVTGGGEAGGQIKLKAKGKPCAKHSSYITHLDFSADGKFIQSNCGAYELLYWSVSGCKQLTSGASSLRDAEWKTFTCTLGWPVQEIFPPGADGTDVNSVMVGGEKKLVVTGDDSGVVKVFNYPVVSKGSESQEGIGHASHVTNVRWLGAEEKMLVSAGGNDKCVILWHVKAAE